jgi:competence protein ComEA
VRALAVLAAVVAIAAGIIAWQARPQVQPVPRPPALTMGPSVGSGPGVAVATTGSGIVVAVSGRVRHPGLVRLPAGARVADAIEAAGGVLPGTDTSLVNLARKVSDGELIVIGLAPAAGAGSAGSDIPADAAPVNLNTATSEQLQSLPGVGPVLAAHIIDYRQAHGGFATVAELRNVTGIGDAKFSQLKDRVTV